MAIPLQLQKALGDSVTSGTFIDTKFWVHSKRGSKSGRVGEPKALFVNGHVAAHVPRLASLFDERRAEENLRARFPTDRRPYTDDYDYEGDSDLEGDDEKDALNDGPAAPSHAAAMMDKPKSSSNVVSIEKSGAKDNEALDMVSVSDLDSLFSESSDTKGEAEIASPVHAGKVIVIEDVAFVTFQALLRYLYTGEIEFAPWGSTERRKARSLEKISESYGIPKPSPKSVYRLAEKYNIPELKELALRQIRQDLSECDIVEELFSKYTSWYPNVRELELRHLARVLLSSDSDPTLGVLNAKIGSYTSGELPHAEHVLPALYELMESDESVEEMPLPAAASPNQLVTGSDWDGLKGALTGSLTSGTFLDSQFYAVESRSSTDLPKIRPIYFCSAVGGSFASNLAASCSKLRAGRAPPTRCVDAYDSDLDDGKPDPEGPTGCYPSTKCVRENHIAASLQTEPALLLKSGAAKTWSSIFLYVYTGRITFAAICSQDVSSKTKETQEGRSLDWQCTPHVSGAFNAPSPGAVVGDPCSPKSIYRLAEKVGLTELCDIAFEDIQSKLHENNIIGELFSPFTADHERIREMEHELFQSKLKPLVDATLLPRTIRSSSSGESPHYAAAMALIFGRSIQERRERMLMKAKNTLRSDPTTQPKNGDAPDISIPQVQYPVRTPTPTPAPAPTSTSTSVPVPQLQSPLTPNPSAGFSIRPASPSVKCEAQLESPTPATRVITGSNDGPAKATGDDDVTREALQIGRGYKKKKKSKGGRSEGPSGEEMVPPGNDAILPADKDIDPPPSEVIVQLTCQTCNVKQLRKNLFVKAYCKVCLLSGVMKCAGCGAARVRNTETCTGCHGRFE